MDKNEVINNIRPNKRASLEDLNKELLDEYLKKEKKENSNFDYNKYLELNGIIDISEDKVYPTLAGTLIFGEYPQSFYPQLFIACSVIPGTKLGDTGSLGERFLDNKRVEDTIEEMIEGTMKFLQRNMKTRQVINSNGVSVNQTEYPLKALREAITNALIHRDYSFQNAYISLYMYNDRIEIINPSISYETDNGTVKSRNATIIKILEEKGLIENKHIGISKMINEMKNYGLAEPEFYEERDSFKVVFSNKVQ